MARASAGRGAPSKNMYEISPHSPYAASPPMRVVSATSAVPKTPRLRFTSAAPLTPKATRANRGKSSLYATAGLAMARRNGSAKTVPIAVDNAMCHQPSGAMVERFHRTNPNGTE